MIPHFTSDPQNKLSSNKTVQKITDRPYKHVDNFMLYHNFFAKFTFDPLMHLLTNPLSCKLQLWHINVLRQGGKLKNHFSIKASLVLISIYTGEITSILIRPREYNVMETVQDLVHRKFTLMLLHQKQLVEMLNNNLTSMKPRLKTRISIELLMKKNMKKTVEAQRIIFLTAGNYLLSA